MVEQIEFQPQLMLFVLGRQKSKDLVFAVSVVIADFGREESIHTQVLLNLPLVPQIHVGTLAGHKTLLELVVDEHLNRHDLSHLVCFNQVDFKDGREIHNDGVQFAECNDLSKHNLESSLTNMVVNALIPNRLEKTGLHFLELLHLLSLDFSGFQGQDGLRPSHVPASIVNIPLLLMPCLDFLESLELLVLTEL